MGNVSSAGHDYALVIGKYKKTKLLQSFLIYLRLR